ncbi:hypothetical protein HX017_06905 [Myroides marinus]|uniref:hypothetical protein n=1 Tax=Myroides marinus TaxID=703342 RepID=UPI0025776B47|nr:hypothetical protein [Myroides marinus]MDM1350039.1 hypothetical protein [Myroides marinus]MDM1357246.1 hypothetical protein [Myroides marinus]MDM1364676.1 hypothetical protein [Myroides marinus]MDM1531614.1 hypothetical protein [Myroides marinus]MDM1538659.1 hypothetical protein [Myroides marinus]
MKKKITTLFLLALGATTYAQSDVPGIGIGTGLPSQSTMLEVKSDNKGVLIPRVDLKALTGDDLTKFGLVGTGEQGVLVYNKKAEGKFVEGFYYWAASKWEAVTSETTLQEVITKTTAELQKEITEKITEITKIPGDSNDPADLSYMVAFKPNPLKDGEKETDPRKGTLQYLVPKEIDDPKNPGKKKITYEKRVISFGDLVTGSETETNISKFYGDGNTSTKQTITVAIPEAVAKTKGKIYYTYVNEKNVTEYLDVTSDFETIIKENETIRKEITNVVKTVDPIDPTKPDPVKPVDPTKPDPGAYGNVYYGDPYKEGKPVLYSVDDKGVVHYINISQNIINEITNNPEIIEKLKETITVKIEDGKPVDTNDAIGGFKVKKVSLANQEVVKGNGTLPYNAEFNATGLDIPADYKFSRLLSVKIFDKTGVLVMSNVTNVSFSGAKLKFNFGTGSMYAPIKADTGYSVVLEYVSTDPVKTPVVKP